MAEHDRARSVVGASAVFAAALAATANLFLGGAVPVMSQCGVSKRELAKNKVHLLARHDYRQWLAKNPGRERCPTFQELTGQMEGQNQDPWGMPYALLCDAGKRDRFVVISSGEDAVLGTADDWVAAAGF